MTEFRTKTKKDGKKQVFPISGSGKTYRRHYNEKPSFATSSNVHGDVKKIMKKDDSIEHGSRDFDTYKKRLDRDADSEYLKQLKKAEKRDDKLAKKQEKEMEKNMAEDEAKSEEEDEQTRAVKEQIEGN